MLVRLHKYLADCGVGSRRKCEEYIRKGLIKINGKTITEMGIKIDPDHDRIETSPQLHMMRQKLVYFAFHKPVGYVSSVTGAEKPKIMELLTEIPERVFPVGRLDKLTSGLLLLTNDGRFAYEMTHPKFEHEKEYVVKVREKITPPAKAMLEKTFYINGKRTQPVVILLRGPHLFHVILKEGRNRQIRRMCQRAGLHIEKLKRIRIEGLLLGTLEPKQYRPLTAAELRVLRR